MAGVPKTVQAGIIDLLTSNTALATLCDGGIWTRKVMRNLNPPDIPSVPGSTPGAFDPVPPYRARLSLSVLPALETADLGGPPAAMFTFPVIWIRCQPKQTEKDRLEAAWWQVYQSLQGARLTLPNGTGCRLRVIGRLGIGDDPDLPDVVRDHVRLQGDGVWRLEN